MKYKVLFSFLKQGLILKMPSAAFLVWTIRLESVLNRKERGFLFRLTGLIVCND